MAKPIKATPVLRGADARRLVNNMLQNKKAKQSEADYERQKAVYEKYKGVFLL